MFPFYAIFSRDKFFQGQDSFYNAKEIFIRHVLSIKKSSEIFILKYLELIRQGLELENDEGIKKFDFRKCSHILHVSL